MAKRVVAQSQAVLDALPRAITVMDRDGVIVGWNAVSETLYGWSSAEALGRELFELVAPPELWATGQQIMKRVLDGERWSGRVRIRRRDGSTLITNSFLGPLRNEQGAVIGAVGAADDATAIAQLEQQTADLADHLHLALSAGQLGTWRWDLKTGVTVWDEQMARLFGVELGAFDGTYEAWAAMLHPEDAQHVLDAVGHAVDTKSPYSVEHRVVWPDGSVHWLQGRGQVILDDAGTVIGTIGYSGDVTDRKLAEANARRRIAEAEAAERRERLQRERLEFLANVNDVALRATDHLDLMRHVAAAAVPRLGDWATVHYQPAPAMTPVRHIAHADPAKRQWAAELSEKYPYDPDGHTGIPAVMRSGLTEFIPEVDWAMLVDQIEASRPDETDVLMPIFDALHLTSLITVPLITKRGVVGAVQFVSAESERRYDASDVALAEAAAGRIAEAIDNAWLMEQQRNIARTLQAALLPAELPEIPGVGIAVRYWAAGAVSEVGGDFYDVFPIGPLRWAVVIGDVCGTGSTAAAVTATARHTIRAAATHGASPVEVLHWVNDAIRAGDSGLFCTLLYCTLEQRDDRTWELTSVTGGHPLPILVAPDHSVSMVGVHGTLIGVLPAIDAHPVTTVLAPGSTMVMHTDGINDVRPPHGLDDDALMAMVSAAATPPGSADDVAERLGTAIADVLPIPQRDDDMAVVVIRLS